MSWGVDLKGQNLMRKEGQESSFDNMKQTTGETSVPQAQSVRDVKIQNYNQKMSFLSDFLWLASWKSNDQLKVGKHMLI